MNKDLRDMIEQVRAAGEVISVKLPVILSAVESTEARMDEMVVEDEKRILTRREYQVLRLLAKGDSTSEISQRLSISTVTVRNHIQRTLKKLNARTRLEAVVVASRKGLLPSAEGLK